MECYLVFQNLIKDPKAEGIRKRKGYAEWEGVDLAVLDYDSWVMVPGRLKYPGSIPRLLLKQGVEVVLRYAWTSLLRSVRSRIHVRSILDRKKAKGQQVKDNGIVVWISSNGNVYQDIKTEEKPCLLTWKRFLGCKPVWRSCYSHVAVGTHANVFPMKRRMLCRVVRFVEAVLWADLHSINSPCWSNARANL